MIMYTKFIFAVLNIQLVVVQAVVSCDAWHEVPSTSIYLFCFCEYIIIPGFVCRYEDYSILRALSYRSVDVFILKISSPSCCVPDYIP